MSKNSNVVKDPNAKGPVGFAGILAAIIVVIVLVGGLVIWQMRSNDESTEFGLKGNYSEGAITLSSDKTSDKAVTADLYEDYSCPHCADLSAATEKEMHDKIADGSLVVNVIPMNFLDRGEVLHSTKSLAALLSLVERGEFDAWWNLRDTFMSDQYKIRGKWENSDFSEAAKEAGASEEAVKAIADGEKIDEAQKVGQANFDKQKNLAGDAYTPRVFVDGKDIQPADGIDKWIDEVLK